MEIHTFADGPRRHDLLSRKCSKCGSPFQFSSAVPVDAYLTREFYSCPNGNASRGHDPEEHILTSDGGPSTRAPAGRPERVAPAGMEVDVASVTDVGNRKAMWRNKYGAEGVLVYEYETLPLSSAAVEGIVKAVKAKGSGYEHSLASLEVVLKSISDLSVGGYVIKHHNDPILRLERTAAVNMKLGVIDLRCITNLRILGPDIKSALETEVDRNHTRMLVALFVIALCGWAIAYMPGRIN